jgi:hypothetical protein
VKTIRDNVEERRRVALYTIFIIRILLAQCCMSLNLTLDLLPVLLSEAALQLPGAFIPNEQEVIGKFTAHPLMRAVGKVHPHGIHHILVCDGV